MRSSDEAFLGSLPKGEKSLDFNWAMLIDLTTIPLQSPSLLQKNKNSQQLRKKCTIYCINILEDVF